MLKARRTLRLFARMLPVLTAAALFLCGFLIPVPPGEPAPLPAQRVA